MGKKQQQRVELTVRDMPTVEEIEMVPTEIPGKVRTFIGFNVVNVKVTEDARFYHIDLEKGDDDA